MNDTSDSGATSADPGPASQPTQPPQPTQPYGAPPPPPPPPGPGAGHSTQTDPPPPGWSGPSGSAGPSDGRTGMVKFFDPIRGIGLTRSRHRVVGGVCGGLAERTGLDPTVVRVIAVVLAIFGGIGVLLYGLGWLLLPEPDGRIHAEEVLHGRVDAGAIGAIVVTVLSLGGGSGGGWGHWGWGLGWHNGPIGVLWSLTGTAVVLAVIVFIVYAVVQSRGGRRPAAAAGSGPMPYAASSTAPYATPYAASAGGQSPSSAPTYPAAPPTYAAGPPPYAPPAPPSPGPAPGPSSTPIAPASRRRPSLGGYGALVGGLALLGAGVAVLITRSGDYQVSTAAIAWAVGLGIIALTLVVGGLLGRRSGIVTLFAIVALVGTVAASVVPKAGHMQAVGQRSWAPTTAAHASSGYALGIGHGTLDLTDLDPATLDPASPRHVDVSVGVGQLTVIVPEGLSVTVHTATSAGSLPRPVGDQVTTSDENLGDGGAFSGRDDDGDLGGVGIKRTVTVGSGAPGLVVDAKVGVGEVEVEQVTP